jgi:putative ABC transport system substrate-binding protein
MQFGQLRRREFIILLGGAVARPLDTRAQPARLPTVGFLGNDATAWSPWTTAFVGRLRELGWIEGRTIAIEYRWSQARPERYAEFADELVRLPVNVIFTFGPAVTTVKQTTATIPIVFALATDPVAGGLVASLARPGGNVTGLSHQANDLAGKCLEVLRQVAPRLRRLAIIANVGYPQSVLEMGEVGTTARTFGLEVLPLEIRRAEDIAPALEPFKAPEGAQANALYVVGDALTAANRTRIITLALGARLPTIFNNRDHVRPELSCPTDQATRPCSVEPPSWSTRFCAEQSRPISRSSSRPSSNWCST